MGRSKRQESWAIEQVGIMGDGWIVIIRVHCQVWNLTCLSVCMDPTQSPFLWRFAWALLDPSG